MANIRMPDGTIIRGVPDGVSKTEIQEHLVKKYGQERFEQMTGSTKRALSGPAASSNSASDYLRNIAETEGRDPTPDEQNEAVRMRREQAGLPEFPENTTKYNNPYQSGTPKTSREGQAMLDSMPDDPQPAPLTGKWAETAQRLREADAAEQAPKMGTMRDELAVARMDEQTGPTSSAPGGGFLGLPAKQTKEERIAEQGRIIERMVSLGIRSAEDYGMTDEEIDSVMEDKTAIEMKRRKDAADAMPDQPQEPVNNEGKSYWKAFKKKVSNLGEEFFRIQEAPEMAARVREQQYETLGAMYLDAVAHENPELADTANDIIDDVAGKYGIDGATYHRTLATQLDNMFQEEQMTIDGVQAYQKELLEDMPHADWEDNKLGYVAGKLIENSNSAAYMLAGLATRSPHVLVALMGTDVYNRTYTDARADGRTQGEAFQDAAVSTIIEGATEGIPLHLVLKAAKVGKGRVAKLLTGVGSEAAQEMFAEAFQMAYDVGVLDEAVSMGDAWIRMRDAGIVGGLMGGGMSAPSIIVGDNAMNNLNDDIKTAKDKLQSVALRVQSDLSTDGTLTLQGTKARKAARAEIEAAQTEYRDAVRAKRKLILEREQAELAKKEGKAKKKEDKRQSKLTEIEKKREAAAAAAEKADQTIKGELTDVDLQMADTLEKAANAELGSEDAEGVQAALDAGYMQITKAGTPVLLQAGKRRLEAIRAAETGATGAPDEIIEPTPYTSPEKRAKQQAVDEEIGRRMRGEEEPIIIEPKPFTSQQRRKADLTKRVASKVTDPAVREKIADDIIKAEEIEETYHKRNIEEAARIEQQRNEDYSKALDQVTDIDLDVAANLALLDEKSVSGYVGTRLGDVLRNAMQTLEKEEAKATAALKAKFANMSTQGTLFDVTGVLVKGTAMYANAVKVGALKIAKHGLKYSAWTADMIGEFGESIRPVLARVYHDSKKKVQDIMKLSHEKFTTGERTGELKYSPKQYAKRGGMTRLRNDLRRLAKEGEGGRLWYEKSGKEILKIAGGSKKIARKLAGLFAIYSSGTAVSANTTNALKMWAQFYGKDGKMVKPKSGTLAGRFSEQDRTAIEWLESDADDAHHVETFGNKRFAFFVNIMREIDPKNYDTGQGVTVDLWMMRALGYDQVAPTDAQYAFASSEIMLIAKEMGWENQQAQAAIWVAIKARWEFIQKKAKEQSVKQGLAEFVPTKKGAPLFEVIGASREEQIENEKKIIGVFREQALKVSREEITKKLEESKADFADNLSKHYATISWEAEPSTKLGGNLNAMSLADKMMMQVEIAEILTNPKTGREYLAEKLDLLGQEQFQGPGAWNMKVGAAVQNSVIVPVKHKAKGAESQPEAAQAMDGYAAILGYLLQQDAVAWHKPFYGNSLKTSNGLEIIGKTLTPAKALKFYEAIYEKTGNMDFAPIVLDGAVRVLNFSEMPNREFHKLIGEAADIAGISGNIEVFQSDGNMVSNDWDANQKGEQYVEAISNNQNARVQETFEWAKRKFARRIAEVYAKYSSEEANARVRTTKLGSGTKLPRLAKGHLRFRHFGKADVGMLEVEKAGTGIKGAESKRGSMKVISAYPNKGFKKEPGLGNNEYVIDVPKTRMYDVNADPMKLKDQAQEASGSGKMVDGKFVSDSTRLDMNKLEQLIKDVGFDGYYTPKASGNLKGQARFFHSLPVDNVQEQVDKELPGTTSTFAISDRPRVTIVENVYEEFEVREKNGEVYYASEIEDAVGTARSIHGADATVVVVDEDGEVITTIVAQTKPKKIKLEGFSKETDMGDAMAVSEFIDEWFEVTKSNPLSPDERVVDDYAAVTLRPQGGQVWIDSLRSFTKGAGNGSRALKNIIELADQHGVTLRLTAKPFDTGGHELDFKQLVQFYQRNGFITSRTTEDYKPSAEMIREPRNVTPKFSFHVKRPKNKTNAGYGMDVQRVRDFTASFGRRLGLGNFKVVESIEELPDSVYIDVMKLSGFSQVNGVFFEDPIEGPTMYVVANNLFDSNLTPSTDMLVDVLMHETIGHFGTRAFLGEKGYNDFMDAIRRAFPAEVKRRGKDMSMTPHGRRLAAEEVFAYFVGENLKGVDVGKVAMSFIDKAMLALKRFLAQLGVRKLSQDDLFQMMFRVTDYVRNTPEALLKKRAVQVERMRQADWAITNQEYKNALRDARIEQEKAHKEYVDAHHKGQDTTKERGRVNEADAAVEMLESGEYVTARFSMNLEKERKSDPALDRFMTKIGHGKGNKLVKLRDWWETRRANIKRSFEIEMLDQFAGIKHMERELGITGPESGYMSVRLTAGTDVIIRSAIENGVPAWHTDGSVTMDSSHLGLLEVLAPIAKDPEMLKAFEAFLVARRAKRLKKENREKLFSREEIGAAFKFIRKNKTYKLFKDTALELAAYKAKVLDFAQEAGLIDPVSRKLWEHNDHVPFYRVLAENNKKGPFASSRIGRVGKAVHRLKGGTDPLRHPLESIVKNLSMLIEASVKNRATADVVNNFMGTGVVTKAPQAVIGKALIPMNQIKDMLFENGVSLDAVGQELLDGVQQLTSLQAPTGDNVISVQENGKKQFYFIHDSGVMRGIDNVSPNQWIWLMKLLRFPKRLLTRSITLMPDFILKNWFRDVFHTYMLHRHGTIIPVLDSGRGWAKAIAHDDTFKDMIAGGGVFDSGFVNASDPDKTNIAIRRALLGKGRHGILDTPKKLKDFYMRIANGAENAHRIVVYQKTLKETGSRKQALFESRDLMDFSVRGANPVIRFLTETVPFWGARVQGISRTAKGFAESPALTLMRSTPIILASVALYMINRDDDRYKKLSEYEKRMYYHFYDVFEDQDHYQLPKPFEVGALFSSIPEVITEYMLSNEPDRGRAAAHSTSWVISEMLSLWPDVQAINPVYELMINKNRFTEAPIISEWEKQLDPRDQYSYRTDKSIKWLADHMPDSAPDIMKSPKQLEHLAQGYIGASLDYALLVSQYLFDKQLNGDAAQPSLRWDETPFFKSFKREPEGKYDDYLNTMYDVLAEADKIHNSINLNKKLPKSDERDERITSLRENNQALLYARGPMDKAASAISKVNKAIRQVYADTRMTPEEKRAKIDGLLKRRSDIAEKVYELRPGGTLNKYEGGDPVESRWDELMDLISTKPKDEQVDELIGAQLPHTATLINDINVSEEKLRSAVA